MQIKITCWHCGKTLYYFPFKFMKNNIIHDVCAQCHIILTLDSKKELNTFTSPK